MGPFRLCRTVCAFHITHYLKKKDGRLHKHTRTRARARTHTHTHTHTHIYISPKHHFINTISLVHVSALKGPFPGSTTHKFEQQGQRNDLPDVQCQSGTAVAQWLRRCATNRKVAVSIPDGVIGIFH